MHDSKGHAVSTQQPGIENLSVSVAIASFSRLGRSWSSAPTTPPHGRLYLITAGKAWMQVGRRTYDLLPGRIYHVPANLPFGYGCPDSFEVYWLHYTARVYGTIDLSELALSAVQRDVADVAAAVSTFERLMAIHRRPGPAYALETTALFLSLLHPFLSRADDGRWPRQAVQRLRPVLDHVDACLGDRLPVAELAAVAHLTRCHFSTEFRKALGVSPRRYILQRRLERALHLLRTTDRTVDDIGRALGFCDGFHFSKAFRSANGLSPTAFRHTADQP
ncbi:MAG: hypothetical protein A3K19_08900 [Lentisphaerae bacterium RIFOXYB12_FULL_65_16]|nr:MAG: hypothetical protein A3K18_13725 [Lentisphaerae bacterium RIFOXYA12_64_32]OGV87665.1 MAG: hypothetical protein A3K19_08900 [Lentisphaerae bacterium RIFOXYB12_FULL_65_16]